MKKRILTFILFSYSVAHTQVNEIGFHLGFGGHSMVNMNNGTFVSKPDFFLKPDSLMKLDYHQMGTVANFPLGINYTHWRSTLNPILEQGISGSFGFGGRVYNTETWQAIDTFTYDTIVVQSSGAKFPVDSIITDNYSMQTEAFAMRFTLGYHYRFNWDRLDFVVGADFLYQQYSGMRRNFYYSQYGESTMPTMFQDDFADAPRFNESKYESEKFRMSSFSCGFQFPLELRFHRRSDKERNVWLGRSHNLGMLGIQATPGIYYLNFNGIDKYYGTCSLGLNWVYYF